MRFAQPEFLWLLWLVPLLWGVLVLARGSASRRLERFVDAPMVAPLTPSVSSLRRGWRSALRLTAIVALILAAARPQWGASEVEVEEKGIDLIVALDISRSMLAQDVKPDRLTRAKLEVSELVEQLRGDRVGLVFFAGAAFPQCPLTVDYSATRLFLSQAEPSMIGAQGTDIASALELCVSLFGEEDGTHRAILLITDGEDFAGGLDDAIKTVVRSGIRVFAVGMGGIDGAPIPMVDAATGQTGYVRDDDGSVVMTRLLEQPLVELARSTQGLYLRAGPTGMDLGRIRSELATVQSRAFQARRVASYEERFAWPLGMALLLLLVEGFVTDRRRRT